MIGFPSSSTGGSDGFCGWFGPFGLSTSGVSGFSGVFGPFGSSTSGVSGFSGVSEVGGFGMMVMRSL